MFFRKTVRKALEGTGWDYYGKTNEQCKLFMKKYGHFKCRFPWITLDKDITYYELFEKSKQGAIHIFQNGNSIFFHDMDPFEPALCICTKKRSSAVEVFRYDHPPFKETMVIQDFYLLFCQFDRFHIFKSDGSRVESIHDLPDHEELLAISKEPFVDTNFHIVIRCIPYGLYCFSK